MWILPWIIVGLRGLTLIMIEPFTLDQHIISGLHKSIISAWELLFQL